MGLKFIHEELKLVHTDLKPENILFTKENNYEVIDNIKDAPINVEKKFRELKEENANITYKNPLDLNIKIIDFGGGVFINEAHSGIINTRQYRSPEVLLGCCKWNEKSDIWSLGCIIAELYTGELLFPTHSDAEHLSLIQKNSNERCFPKWMIDNCKYDFKFNDKNQIDLNSLNSKSYRNYKEFETLNELISIEDQPDFNNFIRSMLTLDPCDRPSCRELLEHKYLTNRY